jgi:hypothetical protein
LLVALTASPAQSATGCCALCSLQKAGTVVDRLTFNATMEVLGEALSRRPALGR